MNNDIEYTDETCPNCGGGILKIDPDDAPVPAYICDPEDGCGMVKRYGDDNAER